jgi:hypothetical protein
VVATGKPFNITLDSFADRWIQHPGDIDLCSMPVGPLREEARKNGQEIFWAQSEESLIPSQESLEELGALEEVAMIGYPNGLWDSVNNYPIIRRGSTASHPAIDFNGKPYAVVDIASFPGSSGSPITILNTGIYSTAKGAIRVGNRALLLGVLYAGPQYTAEGAIKIVEIPTIATPIVTTSMPLHLGYYVKAKEVLTLGKYLFSELGLE